VTAPWATLPRPVSEPLAEVLEARPQVEERDRPVDLARAAEIEREVFAPIPIGVDERGHVITMNVPGDGGRHALIAGASGAGKTTCLHVMLAELGQRAHHVLALADPKEIDLIVHRRRAATIALGEDGARVLFQLLMGELGYRKTVLSAYNQLAEDRGWAPLLTMPIGVPILGEAFDYLDAVVDEVETLTDPESDSTGAKTRRGMIRKYLRLGRALGMGMTLATQRPHHGVIPLGIRDLCRTRLAFGCESPEQSKMILGDDANQLDPPPHKIQQIGEGWLKVDRRYTHFQGYMIEPTQIAAAVARTTRVPGPASWPHVIEDDAAGTCPHCGR
jgi:DNA segregation ATPase FtsK/SpoIIIE-like protein